MNTPPVSGKADNSLERQALAQVHAGHYKDAIALYKKRLQQGENDECYRQMAYCYLQRAKSFAARGMFKEAVALWESHTRFSHAPYQAYDRYLLWLLRSDNPSTIPAALAQLSARQLDQDYPELAAILGLWVLIRHPEWQCVLVEESSFNSHLKIAQEALEAHDLNDTVEALKRLPYRSAFRDIRLLVKACATIADSSDETRTLLDKIPAQSPYAPAARLLRVCTYRGAKLAEQMVALDPPQRRLVGGIVGLNREQMRLIDALTALQDQGPGQVKFDLVIQFLALFDPEPAQRFCLAQLNRYPAGHKDYTKYFGTIDDFENHRIQALSLEQEHRYRDAELHWQQCIKRLKNERGNNGLKIALILRHMAQHQSEPEQANRLRRQSLEYDPADKDMLLQILGFYSQGIETADRFEHWLKQALLAFPQDIEILTQAMKAATRHQAPIKAIQYANNILEIDSLNSFAKQTRISSHLQYARDLIRSKLFDSAEQAIQQAEALKSGQSQNPQITLLHALLCFAAKDKTLGLERFSDTLCALHGDPVNMHLQAVIEAQRCGLPIATLLRALPPAKDHQLSARELTRLIQQLSQYESEQTEQKFLYKALEKVKAPLKKSLPNLAADGRLLLSLCQALDTAGHFELLRQCIQCVAKPWEKPIWVYYQIYADTHGDPGLCDHLQEYHLKLNLDKSKSENDPRARVLIERYLDRYHHQHPTLAMEQFQSADPIDQLFAHVPDETLHKIDKKMETLCKKISPEQMIMELDQSPDYNSKSLVAILNDPNLFTALMMLRAADELRIDLGVSIEQVLRYFQVDKPAPRKFPFPF